MIKMFIMLMLISVTSLMAEVWDAGLSEKETKRRCIACSKSSDEYEKNLVDKNNTYGREILEIYKARIEHYCGEILKDSK